MSNKAIKDLYTLTTIINPAAGKTATTTSSALDMANSEENMFIVHHGAITDGTHTPKLQECATSGGTYTDVAAADQVGTFAAITSSTTAGTFQKVSYIGNLRYIKLVVTVSGTTTGGFYTANMVQKLRKLP